MWCNSDYRGPDLFSLCKRCSPFQILLNSHLDAIGCRPCYERKNQVTSDIEPRSVGPRFGPPFHPILWKHQEERIGSCAADQEVAIENTDIPKVIACRKYLSVSHQVVWKCSFVPYTARSPVFLVTLRAASTFEVVWANFLTSSSSRWFSRFICLSWMIVLSTWDEKSRISLAVPWNWILASPRMTIWSAKE